MDAPVRLRLADEYVSSLVLTGQLGVCEDLINKMKKSPSSEKLAVRLLGRIKDGKRRLRSESLNQEAMTYYKKGQIMDAYGKFSEAASTVGASANVLLNAVRICVELAEREDLNKDEWRKECGAYLERLSELDRCDHRYETYLDYKERYLIL
jgi:Tfp pilus assembly protein PilF